MKIADPGSSSRAPRGVAQRRNRGPKNGAVFASRAHRAAVADEEAQHEQQGAEGLEAGRQASGSSENPPISADGDASTGAHRHAETRAEQHGEARGRRPTSIGTGRYWSAARSQRAARCRGTLPRSSASARAGSGRRRSGRRRGDAAPASSTSQWPSVEARAARVEPAGARRVDRARDVALEHDLLARAPEIRVGDRHGREQRARVRVLRLGVERRRGRRPRRRGRGT